MIRGDHHDSGCSFGDPWGYLQPAQGTAETSRNPRSLRGIQQNKKACEIAGLHRRLNKLVGVVELESTTSTMSKCMNMLFISVL